jgi:glucokinase
MPVKRPGLAVGVDLGGTKIAAGLFDASGNLHGELFSRPTEADGPKERTIENLFQTVDEALKSAELSGGKPAGIGVGSTGPLDPVSGKLLEADNLPHLQHLNLREAIEARYGVAVQMTNDGNAFALAEAIHGAGKGCGIVVGVTLGTGCGCGIVIRGKILEGATANTGEVYRAPLRNFSFDEALSGRGLERIYSKRTGEARPGSEISRLADLGDTAAVEAFLDFGRLTGEGLGILAAVVDPHVIVLGGSVSRSFRHFSKTLREGLARHVAPQVSSGVQVVPAKLGALGGPLGAAALVFSGETIR